MGGLADKIFASIEPKTPEAYCAVIQGMAKHYQVLFLQCKQKFFSRRSIDTPQLWYFINFHFQAERAHALSQEAIEKGIPLSTEVFNSLLACVGFLREGTALRAEALKGLLTQMGEQVRIISWLFSTS